MNEPRISISATKLARNLSAVIDKVRISGEGIIITKGSKMVAELKPPPKAGFPIVRLANLLRSLPKLDDNAGELSKDLKTIRDHAKLPENLWD